MKQIWFNSSLHGLAPTTVYSDYNDRKLIAMKCFLPVFRNCFFLNGHKTLKNRTKLSPLVLWRFYADISCPNSSASLTHSHQKQLYLQLSFPVVLQKWCQCFLWMMSSGRNFIKCRFYTQQQFSSLFGQLCQRFEMKMRSGGSNVAEDKTISN